VALLPILLLSLAPAQEPPWAQAPLDYGANDSHDPVAELQGALATGTRKLARDPRSGLLPALLEALDVSADSQVTVFSRTSFQARRITPQRPRALYFNDQVYVGYVPGSRVLELTAMDPTEGPVFYTFTDSGPGANPVLRRETHACLQCHAPSYNGELPAHLMRSVHPSSDGTPVLRAGAHRVDSSTPLDLRWGGWYVTGDTGELPHLGNRTLEQDQERLLPEASDHGDLTGLCDTEPYPRKTSDVVALLVLEHQTQVHDALTWAGYEARRALHYKRGLNLALGEPADSLVRSTEVRLDTAAEKAARALLSMDEAPLPNPVGAGSPFVPAFLARARRDSAGRSLRDLDLGTRLFRYRLSYLIHGPIFEGLPEPLRERIWLKLWLVLNGVEPSDIPRAEREAILEILAATNGQELPSYW
jgi:hypothetical protein